MGLAWHSHPLPAWGALTLGDSSMSRFLAPPHAPLLQNGQGLALQLPGLGGCLCPGLCGDKGLGAQPACHEPQVGSEGSREGADCSHPVRNSRGSCPSAAPACSAPPLRAGHGTGGTSTPSPPATHTAGFSAAARVQSCRRPCSGAAGSQLEKAGWPNSHPGWLRPMGPRWHTPSSSNRTGWLGAQPRGLPRGDAQQDLAWRTRPGGREGDSPRPWLG